MSMGTLVAGLLGRLINHLTGQHTFVLMLLGRILPMENVDISALRQTDMKSHPTETCILSLKYRTIYRRKCTSTDETFNVSALGQNKFAT